MSEDLPPSAEHSIEGIAEAVEALVPLLERLTLAAEALARRYGYSAPPTSEKR